MTILSVSERIWGFYQKTPVNITSSQLNLPGSQGFGHQFPDMEGY